MKCCKIVFWAGLLILCAITAANAQSIRVPVKVAPAASLTATPPEGCAVLPLRDDCLGTDNDKKDTYINQFYRTTSDHTYFSQIKSIYNGASASTTVSADIGSFNFRNGMQVNVGTNVQAGSSNAANSTTAGAVPTLSSNSAAQATQSLLYGGTVFVSALYPLLAIQASNFNSNGNFGLLVDAVGREGIDVQNFKSGTSTTVSSPPSHFNGQLEAYGQYNSINLTPNNSDFAGSVFLGGSYGYTYMSHDYARDYGFGTQVNNRIGQISAGIVISGVAKIAVSRAFGPSQTFIDSASSTQRTVNNFKSWSFGIAYQSAPAK
jgi:hypothetical protein